ncbi:MAG: hypothetical protein JGK12_23460 [Microcoleus sp. PH2017_01_SCD_O_A]|uniref:hypothetical protein n=1 Tax=unclassified Microcoleus TaxID=2642155 RepID=UPI001DDA8DA0|nr:MULTISPECIES: hypothetical protein [unclassified Microcoleus]MCC3426789.1 hypothetical protein [Microcoleus sp. PH2017_01_SCD_O_A]MCC3450760.1 hypothetical protein [Microcoleus sp. PH2017_09_SFU_O_A]MCC3575158.1 hypothetical protein [Microcoleus sp. PH2017_34_RAT_O_A]MCC3613065.1 hypothetical protein [Microcoleus sp. PH2017_40_RAT_O_B]MCC3631488.1 hypothetical protein [Microcoleus sp. PH2017_39_LGB_O_B]
MYDSARARKLGGVSDSARRGEFERKCVGASRGVAIARYLNSLRKANSPTIADRPAIELNLNSRGKTPEESKEGDRLS